MALLQEVKSRLSFAYGVALLVAINGCAMVLPVWLRWLAQAEAAGSSFHSWKEALGFFALLEIPVVITGCVLVLMSFGLLIKSRISWFFALLLLLAAVCINFFIEKKPNNVTYLSLVSIAVLLYYWRRFDHYSLATGSFFAIVSLASLTVYSTLGTLYLGEQFAPPVTDLTTAFYFALEVMTTSAK